MGLLKSWTEAVQEVREQVGVRKVDFVDGVTPDLQEAKPEFEVKYASSKKGPIKVTKFMSLEDAKKFLAQVKKEGMNGIISKGGKPVKEELDDEDKPVVKKVVKMLKKASQAHAGQADDLEKSMKEEDKIDEHCGECGAEGLQEADYELYHKTFSAAMQHAYAHAKKRGFIVDPDEIDNKVATGPKKPSSGKTNKYILGTNKKQKLHVQVANLDNKRYELNMYIEETEMNEADKKTKDRLKMFKNLRDKKASQGFQKTDLANVEQTIRKVLEKKLDPVGQADADIDNDGDVDSSDKYLKNRRKKISQAIKKDEMYHNKKKMKKESQDDQKGDYGQKKMKRAKEPVAAPVASESKMYSHVKNLLKAQK